MQKRKILLSGLVVLSLFSAGIHAKVSSQEAQKLKDELTPFGAIKAGNEEKTIPEWKGGLTKGPSNYKKSGQHHPDPFPDDKVLYTITSQNVAEYESKLTPGQLALFKTYPTTYKMPVYQSRRTHAAPDWVVENTFKNATTGELIRGGNGIKRAYGGIPFPILNGSESQKGIQAIWNHITRWRGIFVTRRSSEVNVQRNGDFTPVTSQQEVFFNFYNPDGNEKKLKNVLFYYLSFTKSPARLAGGAILIHETMDQIKEPRQAWGYNSGQRRVRRAPNLAYDSPIAASDNLRTADDTDLFNGAPDRYEWAYKGLKEVYIPYNNYKISQKSVKYKDLLGVSHINPDLTRWELHRVHVVEARLKKGSRHIYSKRVFYLDEDSWNAAMVDQYDNRGELWRVSMAFPEEFLRVTWGLDRA